MLLPLIRQRPAADAVVRRSVSVWSAAATAGVGLVARGRLLPTVGRGRRGRLAGRAAGSGRSRLAALSLAAAFPAAAHALAVPGSRPMRLRSPESLIRDCGTRSRTRWSARPPRPARTASPAFAAAEPTPVGDLAEWLADTTDGLAAGARLGLRIEAVPRRRAPATRKTRTAEAGRRAPRTARASLMRPHRRSAGAAAAQQRRPEPDRGRRRAVEPAGDGAGQVRRAGGDRPAAGAAARRGGMAAAGRGAASRPARRRSTWTTTRWPACSARQPRNWRGPASRCCGRPACWRRPEAQGGRHAGAGEADRRRVRPRRRCWSSAGSSRSAAHCSTPTRSPHWPRRNGR